MGNAEYNSQSLRAENAAKRKSKHQSMLEKHPNYTEQKPISGESPIAFALRSAAHLLSPPQYSGESDEIECIDAAVDIINLTESLEEIWIDQATS